MNAQQVQTAADAKALIEAGEGGHVKVATVDPDGVIRRRHMARQTFFSVVESGGKLCGAISGGDCVFSHVSIDVAPNIYLYVLGYGNLLLLIGAFRAPAQAVCRHDLLNRVVDRVAGLGYTASTAVQFMVFIFNETPYSARENGGSQPSEPEARHLGRFNTADIGGSGLSSRSACDGLDDACSSQRFAHGRRTGRFGGRDRMLRSASAYGPMGRVQDLLQGLRPAARQDADIQGKMVQQLARSIRSSAPDVAKRALTPEQLAMAPSTAHFYSRQVLGFWAPTGPLKTARPTCASSRITAQSVRRVSR